MKRVINVWVLIALFLLPLESMADPIGDIIEYLYKIEGYQNTITGDENQIKNFQISENLRSTN